MDSTKIATYLETRIEGFSGPGELTKLSGGQSNPTYRLVSDSGDYVLRTKPPGKLLSSAHAIDREYRVLKALENTSVPTPRAYCYCSDPAVAGREFFVMEYLDGIVPTNPGLSCFKSDDRKRAYESLAVGLAELHALDYKELGLSDYGNVGDPFERQIRTWERQFTAARTEDQPDVTFLLSWLKSNLHHVAGSTKRCLAHGDYRLENVIFDRSVPRVIGVIDWELSTLGHPHLDLAYQCVLLRLPQVETGLSGIGGVDKQEAGLPDEEEYLRYYMRVSGESEIPNWKYCLALNCFRLAAICQGIKKRALDGNAAADSVAGYADRVPVFGALGREVVARA